MDSIIKACMNNSVDELKSLLKDSDITSLTHEDNRSKNAFYYGIYHENYELLNILFNEWKDKKLDGDVDEAISKSYLTAIIQDLPIKDETRIFIELKLNQLRFQVKFEGDEDEIEARYHGIVAKIKDILQSGDKYFIFKLRELVKELYEFKWSIKLRKTICKKISIEKIGFILIIFLKYFENDDEIGFYYRYIIDKSKVCEYLQFFLEELQNWHTNSSKKSCNDKMLELDYYGIRDMYSLQSIIKSIDTVIFSDNENFEENCLLIQRCMLVIGDCVKNYPSSLNMSEITYNYFKEGLRCDFRNIVGHLQNLLNTEKIVAYNFDWIANNKNRKDFLDNIKNDLKDIRLIVDELIFTMKYTVLGEIKNRRGRNGKLDDSQLQKIFNSGNMVLEKKCFKSLSLHDNLFKMINDFCNEIEKFSSKQISLIVRIKKKLDEIRFNSGPAIEQKYGTYIRILKGILNQIKANDHRNTSIHFLEYFENFEELYFTGEDLNRTMIIKKCSEEIKTILGEILSISKNDLNLKNMLDKIETVILRAKNIHFLKEYLENMKNHEDTVISDKKSENLLNQKLNFLKDFLSKYGISHDLNEMKKINAIKTVLEGDKKFEIIAIIEMLILEIFLLKKIDTHQNSHMFEQLFPMLTDSDLRHYIVLGTPETEILFCNIPLSIITNAIELISYDWSRSRKSRKTDFRTQQENSKFLEKIFIEETSCHGLDNQKKDCLQIRFKDFKNENLLIKCLNGILCIRNDNFMDVLYSSFNEFKTSDILLKNKKGQNIFHFAANSGDLKLIEFIIKNVDSCDKYLHEKDFDSKTPLHYAILESHFEIVKFFVEKNHEMIFKQTKNFLRPIHMAIINVKTNIEIFEYLFLKETSSDIGLKEPINLWNLASQFNRIDILKYLKEKNININYSVMQIRPIHFASYYGNREALNEILINDGKANTKTKAGQSALDYAILKENEKIVDILLEAILLGKKSKVGSAILLEKKPKVESAILIRHECADIGSAKKPKVESASLLEEKPKIGSAISLEDKPKVGSPILLEEKSEVGSGISEILLKKKSKVGSAILLGKKPKDGSEIFCAMYNNNLNILKKLLESGIDANCINENKFTPLHVAVFEGNLEQTDLLIKYGANVNFKAYLDQTPLHIAAMNSNDEIAKKLLEPEANKYARDAACNMPIDTAIFFGNSKVVELLHDKNSNFEFEDLEIAVRSGNADTVKLILKNYDTTDKSGLSTLLFDAITMNNVEICEVLLLDSSNKIISMVNHRNMTPIDVACELCNFDVVKLLSDKGAACPNLEYIKTKEILEFIFKKYPEIESNISKTLLETYIRCNCVKRLNMKNFKGLVNYETLIAQITQFAIANGYKYFVEKFLKSLLTNPNFQFPDGDTALHLAVKYSHSNRVKSLIKRKAAINAPNFGQDIPLHCAVNCNNYDVVKVLIENGSELNDPGSIGYPPLHMSIKLEYLSIVQLLLETESVKINLQVTDGLISPLHLACDQGNLEIVKLLMNKSANLYLENSKGQNPIHVAIINSDLNILKYFIELKENDEKFVVDINCSNSSGENFLHFAVRTVNQEVIRYLINHGCKLNKNDNSDQTPLHVSAIHSNAEINKLLLESGAHYNAINASGETPFDVANKENKEVFGKIKEIFDSIETKFNCDNFYESFDPFCLKIKDRNDFYLIHYAARLNLQKHTEDNPLEFLLQHSANANEYDLNKDTPLHHACKLGLLENVRLLLSEGAIYELENNDGKKPSDLAADETIKSLFKLVQKAFRSIQENNLEFFHTLESDKKCIVYNVRNLNEETVFDIALTQNKIFHELSEIFFANDKLYNIFETKEFEIQDLLLMLYVYTRQYLCKNNLLIRIIHEKLSNVKKSTISDEQKLKHAVLAELKVPLSDSLYNKQRKEFTEILEKQQLITRLVENGNYTEASDILTEIDILFNLTDTPTQSNLSLFQFTLKYKGLILKLQNKPREALKLFNCYIEKTAKRDDMVNEMSDIKNEIADVYIRLNQIDEALPLLTENIEMQTNISCAKILLTRVFEKQRDFYQCLELCYSIRKDLEAKDCENLTEQEIINLEKQKLEINLRIANIQFKYGYHLLHLKYCKKVLNILTSNLELRKINLARFIEKEEFKNKIMISLKYCKRNRIMRKTRYEKFENYLFDKLISHNLN